MTTICRWELWRLPRLLCGILLLQAVVMSGALAAVCAWAEPVTAEQWILFGLLLAGGWTSEHLAFRMGEAFAVSAKGASGGVSLSTKAVWIFAAVVACPIQLAAVLALLLSLGEEFRVRRNRPAHNPHLLHRLTFNVTTTTTAAILGTLVYDGGLTDRVHFTPWMAVLAGVTAWLTMSLYTNAVIALVIMLAVGAPYRYPLRLLWTGSAAWVGMASLGFLLVFAWHSDAALVFIGIPPVLLLQQALLHRQLREAAQQDPKTGLAAAARWRELASAALQESRTRGSAVSVLVVDLDHFKVVNDTYGHLVGDDVLVAVAAAMEGAVREGDVLGRFGGEEFVVLLPGAGVPEAARIAERIRLAVAATEVAVAGRERPLRVTTSLGVASGVSGERALEDLLDGADRALYAAKRAGRDRVAVDGGHGTAAPAAVPQPYVAVATADAGAVNGVFSKAPSAAAHAPSV